MSDNIVKVNVAELIADRDKLHRILWDNGFRRCDVPACNCDSWHPHGGFYARFREIDEAVGDHNGKTLLRAVEEMRDELADLRKKVGDFSDGVYQMLVEAGASTDIDTMERQVSAAGTKPSHFVRKSFSELRGKLGEAWEELRGLRAYKERTEAGLVDLSGAVTLNNRTPDDGSHHAFLLNTITWKMRRNGLWRDPPQAEVQP